MELCNQRKFFSRYYRQHCTPDFGSYTKDLSAICGDLNRIFIIDNSPGAYRRFPNNAIPIKTWISGKNCAIFFTNFLKIRENSFRSNRYFSSITLAIIRCPQIYARCAFSALKKPSPASSLLVV